MQVGQRFLVPDNRAVVLAAVARGFSKINQELEAQAPRVARELEMVRLSEAQWSAVVSILRLLRDTRVRAP